MGFRTHAPGDQPDEPSCYPTPAPGVYGWRHGRATGGAPLLGGIADALEHPSGPGPGTMARTAECRAGFRRPGGRPPSTAKVAMPKPPALERADAAAPAAPAIATATLVRNNLIRTLGQPGDLLRVQVRLLWDDFYRANVFVGDASNS